MKYLGIKLTKLISELIGKFNGSTTTILRKKDKNWGLLQYSRFTQSYRNQESMVLE